MARGLRLPITELLKDFDAPVTAFDCGQLCAPLNNGKPVCCESEGVIPVLYHQEFVELQGRSDLWQAFKPTCKSEQVMADELPDYQLAHCTRSCFDERANRSLNCRSFPFLPYFDHDGVIVGLVYDYESAEGKCPLVDLPHTVTREYIRQAVGFWCAVCRIDEEEGDFYRDESKRLRRRFSRKNEDVPVLVEEGLAHYPTLRSDWRSLLAAGQSPPFTPYDRS